MSREDIISRILADAESEVAKIISEAQERADEIKSAAQTRAAEERAETESEVQERAKRICEGRAAAARLESAKIKLAERRRVLDEIYHRALGKLLNLGERDTLALLTRLLKANAEAGDEIVFAQSFAFAEAASRLPVIKELGLTISEKRADISGGCLLLGKKCDKALSYAALLQADAEEHQAEIAAKLFRTR